MKAVVPVRRSLKVRTAFNILGPLLNPANAAYGLIGVYSPDISDLMASALQRLGAKRALVVHSHGLDELTPLGDAELLEVTPHGTRRYRWVGPPCVRAASLQCQDECRISGGCRRLPYNSWLTGSCMALLTGLTLCTIQCAEYWVY